jgi:hypothetical protein
MLKEALRAVANKCSEFAQGELMDEGSVGQAVIGIDENGKATPVQVGPEMTQNDVAGLMRDMAQTCMGIVMIVEGVFADVKKDAQGNLPELPADFKELPDATSAIFCLAYSKEGAEIRRLAYSRNKDTGKYTFYDMGWDDKQISNDCRFANPFNGRK